MEYGHLPGHAARSGPLGCSDRWFTTGLVIGVFTVAFLELVFFPDHWQGIVRSTSSEPSWAPALGGLSSDPSSFRLRLAELSRLAEEAKSALQTLQMRSHQPDIPHSAVGIQDKSGQASHAHSVTSQPSENDMFDEPGPQHYQLLCENDPSPTQLRCEGQSKIKIANAEFGRRDTAVCMHGSVSSTKIYAPMKDVTEWMRQKCDGQTGCSFTPTFSTYGCLDPAPETLKYTDVLFDCV